VAEARRERASPLYLATDTHWRPETVAIVAERLAAFVREHVGLPRRDPLAYVAHDVQVENHGDTALLLALPRRSRLYPPEAVVTRQIRMADGSAWQNDAAADVLLLGDSFSNIYAVRGMGWGEAAGLAEQLSFVLRRPVQRLAQNDAGALAPRRMLAARIARGAAPANTRVVIYQFASRELVDGDWKLINLAG